MWQQPFREFLRARLVPPPGEANAVITRGHTGRAVHIDPEAVPADRWFHSRFRHFRRWHPAAFYFRSFMRDVPVASGSSMRAYRGRQPPPRIRGWQDMGAPFWARARANRYNRQWRPALYLCDSEEGIVREFAAYGAPPTHIQEWDLPLDELRIADFAAPGLPSFLNSVMDYAECCNVPGRPGPADYSFSQLVADLVRRAGFDGMLVPGVHGVGAPYRNLVIFRPRAWRRWSRREDGFREHIAVSGGAGAR